jgi:hypothetical protein
MSEERFEKYNEIINSLASVAIQCTPESWTKATLTIDCDGRAINYKLKNDESEDKANITPELAQLCESLYVTMSQQGDVWVQSVINLNETNGSWGLNVDFKYPESVFVPEPSPSPSPKKSWWKFW